MTSFSKCISIILLIRRCMLPLYENYWASSVPWSNVGKSEAISELWKGLGTNRWKFNILALFSSPQMQTTIHKNIPISYTYSKVNVIQTVSGYLTSTLFKQFSMLYIHGRVPCYFPVSHFYRVELGLSRNSAYPTKKFGPLKFPKLSYPIGLSHVYSLG